MTEEEIEATRTQLRAKGGMPTRRKSRARYVATRVMLEPAMLSALDAIAREQGRSRNDLVREAVRRVWMRRSTKEATG